MWQRIRDWVLVIAMVAGVAGYFIFVNIPAFDPFHHLANRAVGILQPALIFAMLLLTFCRINPKDIRPCRWHLWLLLIQGGAFTTLALITIFMPHSHWRVIFEGAMLLLICPTATAAAVVTRKLGGDIAHITTYTILINMLASLLVPALVPLVHPNPAISMASASWMMLCKVFPLLLLPLAIAILLRRLFPWLQQQLARLQELSFYLWAVALALAIAVTTRSVVHTSQGFATMLGLFIISIVCCVAQFAAGWLIGRKYGDRTTAGQALGQKNTVLAIWMGYTFFTPVTAVVGGFYSIWHNLINSWQLLKSKP